MDITFRDASLPGSGCVVVGILDDRKLTAAATALDKALGGAIGRALSNGRFKGNAGEFVDLVAPGDGKYGRVVLAGLGKPDKRDALKCKAFGGEVVAHLNAVGVAEATVLLDTLPGAPVPATEAAALAAFGARLRSYRFDKYKTKEKPEQRPTLTSLAFGCDNATEAAERFKPLDGIADGVAFTRDLVSEPANVIYPETLADAARSLGALGVEVEVLGVAEMEKLGMGALLGVGLGSAREPRLVIMKWNGGVRGEAPVAFVGKGVTFDTGGISIKPAAGMEDMKWDMGGAGVVIGLMKALAARGAKANVIGVAGLVENMPSGTAQRPGDIVTSMSGQTIEVINTDSEGRLVLADALWYTQDRFKPRAIVDLATLTGAIIIALGTQTAGVFSNDDQLAEQLTAAGKAVDEPVWRLPLGESYDKQINSDAADMKNVGGREAGSITAAQFLQRFVNEVPWAHIDIAGVTWSKKARATVPKGGTGFGVQLLDRFVADQFEAK